MKAIVIEQPWAQLVATGIVSVINRAEGTDFRGRVLLCAASTPVTGETYDSLYIEWIQSITNHQIFGNLPYEDEMPLGAVIGWAELTDCAAGESEGLWDGAAEEYKWRFRDARLFEKPVPCKLPDKGFFEMEDEEFPAAKAVRLAYPRLEGELLVIPVEKYTFKDARQQSGFGIALLEGEEYVSALFTSAESSELRRISAIRFECGGKSFTRQVTDCGIFEATDENGEKVYGYSVYDPDPETYRNIVFRLGRTL